ncbi:MAG: hypothetical protein AABX03_04060 [Nanoarchaeota archaeon]
MNQTNGKPVIAIDIDDTLIPLVTHLVEYYNKFHNGSLRYEDISTYSFSRHMGISEEVAIKIVGDFVDTDYFRCSQPFNGSQESIHHFSKEHYLIGVTSRQESLRKFTDMQIGYFFPEISEIDFSLNHYADFGKRETKSEICKRKNVEWIAEDSPDYALQCANEGIRVFLIDHPWNKEADHELITRLPTESFWDDLLEEVYKEV